MEFNIVERLGARNSVKSSAYLIYDRWDDWSSFRTQFYLVVFDSDGEKHDIGELKIGQKGLKGAPTVEPGKRAPEIGGIGDSFSALGKKFFSLGQNESYYENLWTLPATEAKEVLTLLRDVAFDKELYFKFREEASMTESLMRFVKEESILGRFSRLAHGDPRLTPFDFEYKFTPPAKRVPSPTLTFKVIPYHEPPTNVHVLIGRNGAGKTRFLQGLASALVAPESETAKVGTLSINQSDDKGTWAFASLVYVSFSAFDGFELPNAGDATIKAAQVSLRGDAAVADQTGETTKAGTKGFVASLDRCRRGVRRERWLAALATLESDPLFEEADFSSLLDLPEKTWKKDAAGLFEKLSSGHAVVLLTITRLVELVDEYTLVLIDEPEGHLHPPLLSALIRSLSDLLIKRNGVAIIATHSPVVLQEVPKRCVWKIRRSGRVSVAERPEMETFGENVGVLTSEVFGLEVTTSGFHVLISNTLRKVDYNYDRLIDQFNGQLGAEGRSIARGLAAVAASSQSGDDI